MRLALFLLLLLTSPAAAQRIVSLAPSVTETVFALGMGEHLVGVTTYCDFPEAAKQIDRVGTFLAPNVEAIFAKRPDIVFAVPTPGNRGSVDTLRSLGLEVVVVDPSTLAENTAAIRTIGTVLQRERQATELIASIERAIAAIRARLEGTERRRVLMVVGQTPLIAAGSDTLQSELIELAHGTNLGAAGGKGWPHLSIETAIASAPEVIIDSTMGNEERAGAGAALEFWKAFPTIPAVRNGRISGFRAYELLRPGPRVAEAFETIARIIHPERFAVSAP